MHNSSKYCPTSTSNKAYENPTVVYLLKSLRKNKLLLAITTKHSTLTRLLSY